MEILIISFILTIIGSICFKFIMWIAELGKKEKTKIDIICGYGAWIGYFERLIIYWSLLIDVPVLIIIIVFMKVILRLKERKVRVDYILLGTLFNIVYALMLVIVVITIK